MPHILAATKSSAISLLWIISKAPRRAKNVAFCLYSVFHSSIIFLAAETWVLDTMAIRSSSVRLKPSA